MAGAFAKALRDRLIFGQVTDASGLGDTTLDLHLFKNDLTPNGQTVVGDFEEADFDGYAAESVDKDEWVVSYDADGGTSLVNNILATFAAGTLAGSQTIFGWYLTRTGGVLLCSSRFQDPLVVGVDGQVVPVIVATSLQPNAGRKSPADTL